MQSVIDGEYILLRERLLRQTWPSLLVRLELDYQALNRIDYVDSAPGFTPPAVGTDGSRNLGIGLGVLYDDIHNAMNPREGLYSEWAFLRYGAGKGGGFDFTTTSSTTASTAPSGRTPSSPRRSTASSRRASAVQHAEQMGGESLMRGYYLGRYRDQNLLAAQVEYRILPFPSPSASAPTPSSPPAKSTATTTRSPGSSSCPPAGPASASSSSPRRTSTRASTSPTPARARASTSSSARPSDPPNTLLCVFLR